MGADVDLKEHGPIIARALVVVWAASLEAWHYRRLPDWDPSLTHDGQLTHERQLSYIQTMSVLTEICSRPLDSVQETQGPSDVSMAALLARPQYSQSPHTCCTDQE